MKLSVLSFAAVAVISSDALAQLSVTTRGRGPFSAFSHLHSMEGAAGNDENLLKPVGDQSAVPSAPVMPVNPDPSVPIWRLDAMFAASDLPNIEIDAMSTGNDLLQIDPQTGQVDLSQIQAWGALTYSVRANSTGQPGSWVGLRTASNGGLGVGADVMSHIFESSVGIEPRLRGENFLEQRAEDMGHAPGDEIDALDFFAPLLTMNGGTPGGVLFVNQDTFYFSVTSASAAALGASFFGNNQPSGAYVMKMVWDPTLGKWGAPTVFRTPAELACSEADEVDAIGYNSGQGALIFSTKVDADYPQRAQLEVSFDNTPISSPMVITANPGEPLWTTLRITDTDDIDAICGIDPEAGQLSSFLGTPVKSSLAPPGDFMHLSASRITASPAAPDGGIFQVSGWGPMAPQACFTTIVYKGSGASLVQHFGTIARGPTQDTVEIRGPLPGVPTSTTTGLPGTEIRFIALQWRMGMVISSYSYVQAMRL